jgi:hypothetical protein
MGESKKMGLKVKRVFEWILFFLSVVFILFLVYFQVSWKFILAFAFLFYVQLLIPERHHKKLALFVWIVLLAIFIWILLPEEEKGWRPYIRYDQIVAHEKELLVPDDENAAIIYRDIFDTIDMDEFRGSVNDVDDVLLSTFWRGSDYPDAAQLLNRYSTIIDKTFDAAKLDRCYFPLLKDDFQKPENYNEVANFWYAKIPEMSLKHVGDFLLLSANNDVSKNHYQLGLEKYFTVLQIADHMRQQSEVMDVLIGMSLEGKAFRCLHDLLLTTDLNSEDSNIIKERLEGINHVWKTEIKKVFDRDKLRNKSFMYAMLYQINEVNEIRYNRDPNSTLPSIIFIDPDPYDGGNAWIDRRPQLKHYLKVKLVKASLLFTSFFVPSNIDKTEEIFNENLTYCDDMLMPGYDWQKKEPFFTWKTTKINLSFFSKMMLEGIMAGCYENVHKGFLKIQAIKQATQIIIVLKRYKDKTGHWPESLDVISAQLPDGTLVDPMNNGAFVYYPAMDSFVLYSRGQNDKDEYDRLLRRYADDPNDIDYSLSRPDDIGIWPYIGN